MSSMFQNLKVSNVFNVPQNFKSLMSFNISNVFQNLIQIGECLQILRNNFDGGSKIRSVVLIWVNLMETQGKLKESWFWVVSSTK